MGSGGKKVWKKVTSVITGKKESGGSSNASVAAKASDSSVGGNAAAEAEKAVATEFAGALSNKGKKAKKSGTELGGGQRTFGALSETLG